MYIFISKQHTKNILIKDGDIKISDFGMSKGIKYANVANKQLGVSTVLNSCKMPAFASDKAFDVYSLGVILLKIIM